MKDNRKKIAVINGWRGKNVEYSFTCSDGSIQKGLCSLEEWMVWEIKQKLIAGGADESLVEELCDRVYAVGYDAAETDYAEQDAGESL